MIVNQTSESSSSYGQINLQLTNPIISTEETPIAPRELTVREKMALVLLKNRVDIKQCEAWLLDREDNGGEFDAEHYYALEYLITKKNKEPQDAINELANLSPVQAKGIPLGLTAAEASQFTLYWHIFAYAKLKDKLTPELLLQYQIKTKDPTSLSYFNALDKLMKGGMSPQHALNNLNNLTEIQACSIYESSFTLCEARAFANDSYITAYRIFANQSLGSVLTFKMLLAHQKAGCPLEEKHIEMLYELTTKHNTMLSAPDALLGMHNLSVVKAKDMMPEIDERLGNVLGLRLR